MELSAFDVRNQIHSSDLSKTLSKVKCELNLLVPRIERSSRETLRLKSFYCKGLESYKAVT